MDIKINEPIEVSHVQFRQLKTTYAGFVAYRYDEKANKYYIKILFPGRTKKIKRTLELTK